MKKTNPNPLVDLVKRFEMVFVKSRSGLSLLRSLAFVGGSFPSHRMPRCENPDRELQEALRLLAAGDELVEIGSL